MGRLTLAVLYGGRSGEHEVSCVSARNVIRAADPDRFSVVEVFIAPDGRWSVDGMLPFRRQRDLHRRHFPGNSR